MHRLFAAVTAILAVVFLACLARPATAAAAVPGLAGEMFIQTEPIQLTHTCDATGNSTISFSTSGIATGPYPGTFTESGTITIGPQTLPLVQPSPLFTLTAGQVLTFQAQFTIDSADGQVTGQKTLVVEDPSDQGACVDAPVGVFVGGFGPETCTDVDVAQVKAQNLQYSATINSPLGTSSDSGGSVAYVDQDRENCPLSGNQNESAFQETFYENQPPPPPANTPGHATGGGMIGAAPVHGVTLAFHAYSDGTTLTGGCNVLDHDTGVHVVCLDVTAFVVVGNTVTIEGDATIDDTPTRYRIVAQDNGEPNTDTDTFTISTDSGYVSGGTVNSGNIQLH